MHSINATRNGTKSTDSSERFISKMLRCWNCYIQGGNDRKQWQWGANLLESLAIWPMWNSQFTIESGCGSLGSKVRDASVIARLESRRATQRGSLRHCLQDEVIKIELVKRLSDFDQVGKSLDTNSDCYEQIAWHEVTPFADPLELLYIGIMRIFIVRENSATCSTCKKNFFCIMIQ